MAPKRWLCAFMALGAWCITTVCAAGAGGVRWDKAPIDPANMASLQNGARAFSQYCLGCHATAAVPYSRLQDIGLSPEQIRHDLLPPGKTLDDPMGTAVSPEQSTQGSVAAPPDLGLVTRAKSGQGGSGADYVYTYLRSFYRDPTTRSGWNNAAAPHTAMPHTLWHLQGERQPLLVPSAPTGPFTVAQWRQITPGQQTPAQFDTPVGDIVNYLQWVADPGQRTRKKVGGFVVAYLCLLALAAWRLQRAYWKDVE